MQPGSALPRIPRCSPLRQRWALGVLYGEPFPATPDCGNTLHMHKMHTVPPPVIPAQAERAQQASHEQPQGPGKPL